MKKVVLAAIVFTFASLAQASTCNLAKIDKDGFPSEFDSMTFSPSDLELTLSVGDFTAKVETYGIETGSYRQLTIENRENSSSALFLRSNNHPFLSTRLNGEVVQIQCWIDTEQPK